MQVQQQLNVSAESLHLTDDFLKKSYDLSSILPPGHHINKPEVLFRNITDEEVEQLRNRFTPGQIMHCITLAVKWPLLAFCTFALLLSLLQSFLHLFVTS